MEVSQCSRSMGASLRDLRAGCLSQEYFCKAAEAVPRRDRQKGGVADCSRSLCPRGGAVAQNRLGTTPAVACSTFGYFAWGGQRGLAQPIHFRDLANHKTIEQGLLNKDELHGKTGFAGYDWGGLAGIAGRMDSAEIVPVRFRTMACSHGALGRRCVRVVAIRGRDASHPRRSLLWHSHSRIVGISFPRVWRQMSVESALGG